MRGSVHIQLPKISKDMPRFKKIADEFHVQIRGIHGEHSESNDGTYDISNKRRLGRSDKDLVQDMYNGFKAIIAAEKALWKGRFLTRILSLDQHAQLRTKVQTQTGQGLSSFRGWCCLCS